jgi:hypothetical protein
MVIGGKDISEDFQIGYITALLKPTQNQHLAI